ncbi:MAG: isochorismatase family protein [Cyclobacteriaceae bacterium]
MGSKALIVIDMQHISFTPRTVRFDTVGVIARINALSHYFRKAGNPVLFIQHDGTKEGACLPCTEEWKLLPELDIAPADQIVPKTANDAFYRSDLMPILSERGVKELVITGCATDFCVDATVQSALVHDYAVTVVQDGHTTADRPHGRAEQLIAHYNWVWQNMIPTQGCIRVLPASEILTTELTAKP